MPKPTLSPSDQADFGFTRVPLEEKQGRVNAVFSGVARRYDVMNDVMSAGLHRVWKNELVRMLAPPRHRPFHHLDVAGGTGDVAFRILSEGSSQTQVDILDINTNMLVEGRARAPSEHKDQMNFITGNAEALPVPDGLYDGYTIAFGIRNVPRIDLALKEAYRALKIGGRFLCLEFSHVDVPGLDKIYDFYSFNMIPALGEMVAGDRESYRYLVESIRRFPTVKQFARQIEQAGFDNVSHRIMTGGVVAIHSGWKL
jgi:demethylmenaquinone methyltransferase / 2-methoxy-6-polyprenyl-1,4-benzoquinol methylase